MMGHDRRRAMKRKLLAFGATVLAVSAFGSVALTDGAREVRAADGTPGVLSNPGSLVRSNVGVVTSANSTVIGTYVVIGPNGVVYGPDGTAIVRETPPAYVNGVVGGTPSSAGPQFTISTPTAVIAPQSDVTTTTTAAQSPQRYYIGSLDAPSSYTAPIVPTPVGANIITGSTTIQATVDPSNNPNVIIGTPTGGVNSSGVVMGNGRGVANP